MTEAVQPPLGLNVLNHKGEVLIVMTQNVNLVTFNPDDAEHFANAIITAAKAARAGEPPSTTKQ